MRGKVWTRLESFTKGKYPQCIIHLLEFSAYSTELSLLELDETKIEGIEKHINANRHVLNELDCCYSEVYKNQPQFQFLPGHRSTVLGIKNQITKMKEGRTQKRGAPGGAKSKRIKSAEELKEMLIDSLDAFSQKLGFPKDLITNNNIVDFHEQLVNGQTIYKCGFSCVFCSKVTPIQYKGYWQTSNATGHYRIHYTTGMLVTVREIIRTNAD